MDRRGKTRGRAGGKGHRHAQRTRRGERVAGLTPVLDRRDDMDVASPEFGSEEWARNKERPFTNRWNGKPHDPARCCASVADDGRSPTFHQCSRNPKVFYGSLGYCSTHDPVAAKARRDAKYA